MWENMKCLRCHGIGRKDDELLCHVCNGIGSLTDEQARQICNEVEAIPKGKWLKIKKLRAKP